MSSGPLNKPQSALLTALFHFDGLGWPAPSRAHISFLSGYSKTSGSFRNALGRLRSFQLIDYPDKQKVALTDKGRVFFDFTPVLSPLDFAAKLSKCERAILATLLDDGASMEKSVLANLTRYSETSGSFRNALGHLRSFGLITPSSQDPAATETARSLFAGYPITVD